MTSSRPATTTAPGHINDLWGYYISGTSTQELTCNPTEIFTSSSIFGGCYATSYIASTSTLIYGCTQISSPSGSQVGGVRTCASNVCITQTIYQTYPNIGPLTNYFCAGNFPASTVYRAIPSTSTTSSTSSSSASTPSPTTATNTAATTTPATTPTSTPSPTSASDASSSSSQAWIAGPVVGVIALIALIAFLFFYLQRRRKRTRDGEVGMEPQRHSSVYGGERVEMAGGGLSATGVKEKAELETGPDVRRSELGSDGGENGVGNGHGHGHINGGEEGFSRSELPG